MPGFRLVEDHLFDAGNDTVRLFQIRTHRHGDLGHDQGNVLLRMNSVPRSGTTAILRTKTPAADRTTVLR